MPTIDELAPATAASDGDELVVSQNSITRKVTRAQILAGVQTQLFIPSGTVLGRIAAGSGPTETISIGQHLTMASGTLSADAAPYSIGLLPAGLVPASGDLVPLGQGGNNTAVTYRAFLQGLSGVAGIDGTQLTVTPTGSNVSLRLADFASSTVSKAGGSMSGPLNLASDPSVPLQAATKQYVDFRLNRTGDTLSGPLQLIGDPTTSLQAATKLYVDTNSAFPRLGFTMTGPIILAADPTSALGSATKSYTDARLLRSGDTMSGPLGLSANPVSGSQATTKSYVDDQIATSLPLNGGALSGPLTLSADPTNVLQAATKQYADMKVARTGDTLSGFLTLAGSPTNAFHATPKNYVDTQLAALLSRSGGTMSGPILLSGDPTSPSQAATKYYVDSGLGGVLSTTGGTVTGPIILTANPALPPHVVNKQYVDAQLSLLLPLTGGSLSGPLVLASSPAVVSRVFNVSIPFSVSVLDTTGATQLPGAAAIRMAPGHSIAFEGTNSVNLAYSAAMGAIVAKYGATTCAVGRGISVSFGIVFSTTATIPSASAGSIVFLVGGGSYTITLPPATAVMAGTGFTFSAIGSGVASIVPASGDSLELAPSTLHQYDRYHIISDGSSLWREIFKTNSVSPRFTAPPILPSYSVTNLPGAPGIGAKAFVTNGRKPGELAGRGTGVEVFYDGSQWICGCSGTLVAA